MASDYDIEMTTDDTLELDTIIEQIDNSNSLANVTEGGNHNLNVIETQTEIFDPIDSGEYKININGQVLSINVTDVSAIPDSGLIHNFDPRQLSVSDGKKVDTRTNQKTTGDNLSATGSPTYRTSGINGNAIVEYDGSDDYHQGTFSSDISTPVEIFHVFQARSISQSETYFSGESETADWLVDGNGNWQLFDGNNAGSLASNDTNAHIGVARFATDGEIQLENNSSSSTIDVSSVTFGGITIGSEFDGGNPAPIDSGQFLLYNPSVSGYSRSDVIAYLKDEWGSF